MEASRQKRKACDLCYKRKLKCDGREPHCSNCVIYGEDCTHVSLSRRATPRAQRGRVGKYTREIESLQGEVQRLKEQLAEKKLPGEGDGRNNNEQAQALQVYPYEVLCVHASAGCRDHRAATTTSLKLPPLHQALSMVGTFVNGFNSVLPLFDADTVLRLVGECYAKHPSQRDPVEWAAVNVVLALANQHGVPASAGNRPTDYYLNRAQSVMTALMLGDLRLLTIQTLVGIAMVLQTAHDPTPALILTSATMRLARKMGLHDGAASAHLDPVERRQRARVFWLAYILDKDLSLRAQQPSIQRDDDINVDLPSSLPVREGDDGAGCGVITAAGGKASMNYFLARVQLAAIQGAVYDYLHSTRAMNLTPEERTSSRESILDALEQWKASIPPEFGSAAVASNMRHNPASLGFFCTLHAASIQCFTYVNLTQSWDNPWLNGVYDQGGSNSRALQLPPRWGAVVRQVRDFMVLFGQAWSKDAWFCWMVSCAYASSIVLLTANCLSNLEHDMIQTDTQLVDKGLAWVNKRADELQKEDVQHFRTMCVEMVRGLRQKRAVIVAMGYDREVFPGLLHN